MRDCYTKRIYQEFRNNKLFQLVSILYVIGIKLLERNMLKIS